MSRSKLTKEEYDKKKSSLLAKQRRYVNLLKKKNRPVYDWFVARGIDFSNLHKQTQSFVAAATMLISISNQKQVTPLSTAVEEQHVEVDITKSKKTETERAQAIWGSYGQLIRESAAKYDVDPNLIFATIMIESGGNPRAIRYEPRLNDASYGLGQLLYGTARGLGYRGTAEGLYDPATNIDLIARYHRRNLDHYGHLTPQQLTIAYNSGSPYKKAIAGHIDKFNKWYNRVENLELDLT